MQYRHNIKKAIRDLEAEANGLTKRGDRISFEYKNTKFMILLIDRAGIKEGWTSAWYPYTKKNVDYLKKIISGKAI